MLLVCGAKRITDCPWSTAKKSNDCESTDLSQPGKIFWLLAIKAVDHLPHFLTQQKIWQNTSTQPFYDCIWPQNIAAFLAAQLNVGYIVISICVPVSLSRSRGESRLNGERYWKYYALHHTTERFLDSKYHNPELRCSPPNQRVKDRQPNVDS